MTSKIQNDYGNWVTSTGSENSITRIQLKYPKLISKLSIQFEEIPVTSVLSYDLVHQQNFEKWEADLIAEAVAVAGHKLPFGPSKNGSARCESGSIASGGNKAHCSCDICF